MNFTGYKTKHSLLSGINADYKHAKLIEHATLKIDYSNVKSAIRYHDTNVVTYDKNKVILDSGGYRTNTTKKRINDNIEGLYVYTDKSIWYVRRVINPKTFLFYDGITFNVKTLEVIGKEKPIEKNKAKTDKIKKQIKSYVDLITEDNLPRPDLGDCFYCSMFKDSSDIEHLKSHIKEHYLVGSLLVNAMREKGYTDQSIGLHYSMNLVDTFKRALRQYLYKRLLK